MSYKFRVGDPVSGKGVWWDGTNLTVHGSLTVTGGAVVGSLDVNTSGVIRSGATAFGTATGIWLDFNAGTPRFRIGDPAGSRLSWDGMTLKLVATDIDIDTGTVDINNTGIMLTPSGTIAVGSRAYEFKNPANDLGQFGLYGDLVVTGSINSTKSVYLNAINQNTGTTQDAANLFLSASSGAESATIVFITDDGGAGAGNAQIQLQSSTAASSASLLINYNGIVVTGAISVTGALSSSGQTSGDTLRATVGVYERGRSVPQGEWIAAQFNVADFTAEGGGSWGVETGDVAALRYMLIGKTMWFAVTLGGTTTAGTVTLLKIKIPGGFTSAGLTVQRNMRYLNGGAYETGIVGTQSDTFLRLHTTTQGNWAAGTNNVDIAFVAAFEVQ